MVLKLAFGSNHCNYHICFVCCTNQLFLAKIVNFFYCEHDLLGRLFEASNGREALDVFQQKVAGFDLNIPENILIEQAVRFSGTEDEICLQINTLDNYFMLKMVAG